MCILQYRALSAGFSDFNFFAKFLNIETLFETPVCLIGYDK